MSLFNRMRVTQVQILINRLMIIRPIFRFFNQDLPLTDIHSQGSVTPEAMSRIIKFSWTWTDFLLNSVSTNLRMELIEPSVREVEGKQFFCCDVVSSFAKFEPFFC